MPRVARKAARKAAAKKYRDGKAKRKAARERARRLADEHEDKVIGVTQTVSTGWQARFKYTLPPAVRKGPSPAETRWTPVGPSGHTLKRRASRHSR